jgi:UDPglucose--hexose-1-phosphate uridylyltransferase
MTIETRVDPETGEWRLIAPARAARPDDSRASGASRADAVCPFCPGNEHMTPPERMRVPAGELGWRIRVVPNKYAVVSRVDESFRPADRWDGRLALVESFPATGDHEVVIESPRHDWDLRHAGPDQAAEILFAVRERCRALSAGRPAVAAFRNYGKAAGASLSHPHSQIVALDHVPPPLAARWQRTREHHAATGRRLIDDLAASERTSGGRVVVDVGDLLVFQPYAAAVPHHTLLVPGDGRASFADASDDAVGVVARVLPRLLTALAKVLDDPAYNLVLHAGPADEPDAGRWYQWYLGLYPRVSTIGGLELATGLAVNARSPEQTAPILRTALSSLWAPTEPTG